MSNAPKNNPYEAPRETPQSFGSTGPGPLAIIVITLASVAAGVFVFFFTCFGTFALGSPLMNQLDGVGFVAGIVMVTLALVAAFWSARAVAKMLTAAFQKPRSQDSQ